MKRVIVIKKLALIAVFALVFAMLAGCAKAPAANENDPFVVLSSNGKKVVRLGDKREDTEKLLGPDPSIITEFEEDGVERVDYWDSEGITVEYKDGHVCSIRFNTNDWKTSYGFTTGGKVADAKKYYPKDKIHEYAQAEGLWISYNPDGEPIDFSEDAPYYIHVSVQNGTVSQITIQDNWQ